MNRGVHTSSGIVLISGMSLVHCIKKIEASCPGWWWSISQTPGKISLSMGPGRNCPYGPDNLLAQTKQGDAGYHISHAYTSDDTAMITAFIDRILLNMKGVRGLGDSDSIDIPQTGNQTFRRQSDEALEQLTKTYNAFCDSCSLIESDKKYVLEEVYLGSCDLSVDCSLRGIKDNKARFDYSIDLADDAILAQSIMYAVEDITYDILYPE